MNTLIKKLKLADRLLATTVFCVTLLLFLPSVWFDADIFDDFSYLNALQGDNLPAFFDFIFTPVLKLRSPLVQLSFFTERLLWGKQLFSYGLHLSNIIYHASGAVLLYVLCRKLRLRPEGKNIHLAPAWCAAAALLWACHPQRVESVAWISERKDLLLAICFFSALIQLIRFIRTGRGGYWAFFLYLLSYSVKPMLIIFPFIVFVLLRIETGKFFSKRNNRICLPYFLSLIPFLLYLSPTLLQFSGKHPPFYTLGVIFTNIGNYFKSAVIPDNLLPFYPFYHPRESFFLPTAVFILLLAAVYFFCNQKKELRNILLLTLLLFPVTLAPVSGFVRIGNCDWADRYNLLPSCFLLIPAIFLLQSFYSEKKFQRIIVVCASSVYLLFLIIQTSIYLPVWRSYKSVLIGSVENIKTPNYRIAFIASFCAFLEKDYMLAQKIAFSLNPEDVYLPSDRNFILLFRESMTGLLEMLSKDQNRGGKRLTNLLLANTQPLLVWVSSGYLDVVTDAAAYWNLKNNNPAMAAKLYRLSEPHTNFADKKLVYSIKADLLENNFHRAEQTIRLLKQQFPRHVLLKDFEQQLKKYQNGQVKKNEK